jgi:hypothetical protein
METDEGRVSLDLTKLREQRRPLWMSPLGITSFAEMIGAGGDIYSDRLTPDWPRFNGDELEGEDEVRATTIGGDLWKLDGFPPQSELTSTVEEAFKYVHFSEEGES